MDFNQIIIIFAPENQLQTVYMIKRLLEKQIVSLLGSGKAIIIMGARQVGKSTLLDTIFHNRENTLWMTGDDLDVQELFSQCHPPALKPF